MKFIAIISLIGATICFSMFELGCSFGSIHHYDSVPIPYTITETITCRVARPGSDALVSDGSKIVMVASRCNR